MAVIECDWHNREHPADVMVSQLVNGETFAACNDGFLSFCIGIVEAAAEAEASTTADDANARLADAAHEAGFPSSPASSGEGGPDPEPPTRRGSKRARSTVSVVDDDDDGLIG